jgi:hypothetical protein
LIVTVGAPATVRLLPLKVTVRLWPCCPLVGVLELIAGAATTVRTFVSVPAAGVSATAFVGTDDRLALYVAVPAHDVLVA